MIKIYSKLIIRGLRHDINKHQGPHRFADYCFDLCLSVTKYAVLIFSNVALYMSLSCNAVFINPNICVYFCCFDKNS